MLRKNKHLYTINIFNLDSDFFVNLLYLIFCLDANFNNFLAGLLNIVLEW